MMMFLNYMQGSRYKDQLRREIDNEREKNKQLKARAAQLDKQIGSLQKDSIGQLKERLGEVRLKCCLCRVKCGVSKLWGYHKKPLPKVFYVKWTEVDFPWKKKTNEKYGSTVLALKFRT